MSKSNRRGTQMNGRQQSKPDIDWAENYSGGIPSEYMVKKPIAPPRKYRRETKEAWRKVMALEVERGILAEMDMIIFGMMFDFFDSACWYEVRTRNYIRKLLEEGKDPSKDTETLRTYAKLRNGQVNMFLQSSRKFLLTPSDLKKMGIDMKPSKTIAEDIRREEAKKMGLL